jgi:hypothetical protein
MLARLADIWERTKIYPHNPTIYRAPTNAFQEAPAAPGVELREPHDLSSPIPIQEARKNEACYIDDRVHNFLPAILSQSLEATSGRYLFATASKF